MSLKKEISVLLSNIANLLEFQGANKFKSSAYRNGANTIRRLEDDLEIVISENRLKDIKGIGKGIQSVIEEYTGKGYSSEYAALLKDVPPGIVELFSIRGIGPGKVRVLYEELDVNSVETLEHACRENSVAGLKGFGEKLEQKILAEVMRLKRSKGYMLLSKALEKGRELKSVLLDVDGIERIEFTGQLRRRNEIISQIELIAVMNAYNNNYMQLANLYQIKKLSENDSHIKLQLGAANGAKAVLIVTDSENFGNTWFQTTGSVEFFSQIDLNLIESGFASEEDVFKKLSIKPINAEMREGAYWNAPHNLQENSNLSSENFKGLLHFHTTKSDGQNTLLEMVEAATDSGFEYLAVCDHSKSAFYANGLTEDRILLQRKEIEKVTEQTEIKIFHGIESDILRDGSLDYSEDFMNNFDFVVASIHSIFELSEEEMTSRMIRAIENPHTDLIAHPTGRLLLSRDPYRINIMKVIDACAENDVAIEINASPHRLDLDWRNIYYAREKGCKFAINPDAHSVHGIDDSKYGIMIARKGGIQPEEVINCFSGDDFSSYINRKLNRNS